MCIRDSYNVGYRMLSVLLPIVTAPYLARTVGQEGTGLYLSLIHI